MRQAHRHDDGDPGRGEVRSQRRRVDREIAGLHRVADRARGDATVTVDPHRQEVIAVAEGRVDPLIAEHRDTRPGRLAIQHCHHGPEQRLAVNGRGGRGGLRAVRADHTRGRAERKRAQHE